MNFRIGTKESFAASEEKVAKVEFSLKTNADGSVGLYIYNSAFGPSDTNVELLRIGTEGIISRTVFSDENLDDPKIFMKYDVTYGSIGTSVRVRVV